MGPDAKRLSVLHPSDSSSSPSLLPQPTVDLLPSQGPHPVRSYSGHPYRLSYASQLSDSSRGEPRALPPQASNIKSTQVGLSSDSTSFSTHAPAPRLHLPSSVSHGALSRPISALMLPPRNFAQAASYDEKRQSFQPSSALRNVRDDKYMGRRRERSEPFSRRNFEPANLIDSVGSSSFTSRTNSMAIDSRRVVTGVLQSALPPSSRPVLVDNTPVRSMSITELQGRHKAALQKLQTHGNQHAAKTSTSIQAPPRSKILAPPQSRSGGKAIMSAQASVPSTSKIRPSPQVQPRAKTLTPSPVQSSSKNSGSESSSRFQANKRNPNFSNSQSSSPLPRTPESSGKKDSLTGSLRSTKSGKPGGQEEKETSSSHRRLFGIWNFKSHSKPPKATGKSSSEKNETPNQEENAIPQEIKDNEEEEDEDIPLAQLLTSTRRASYNPTSKIQVKSQNRSRTASDANMLKSISAPNMMNVQASNEHVYDRRKNQIETLQPPVDSRGSRIRRASWKQNSLHGCEPIHESDQESSPVKADFDLLPPSGGGPRPLIFEDEARAIRNSRRFWS